MPFRHIYTKWLSLLIAATDSFYGGWIVTYFVSLNWFQVDFSTTINERRYPYLIFHPATGWSTSHNDAFFNVTYCLWKSSESQFIRRKSYCTDIVESAVLNGKASLAERFAEIDIIQVRQAHTEAQKSAQRYPKRMAEVFKIPHLPRKMAAITPKG